MSRNLRPVAAREITERLRGRMIRVLTALTSLLVVAIIVIPAIVRQPAKPTVVGLVGHSAQQLAPTLRRFAAISRSGIRTVDLASDAVARSSVRSGTVGVALGVGGAGAVAVVNETLSPDVAALLRVTLDQAREQHVLAEAGVSPATMADALAPVPLTTAALRPPRPDRAARSAAAFSAALLRYLVLSVYGAAVANGVAQEKTSRTAEVLLAAVTPDELLSGKVLGIGVVGLCQMGVTVLAGLAANAAVQRAEIPSVVWGLLPETLLWFVLGYALYAFGFAASCALVARQEDVELSTAPLTVMLATSYLLVYAAIGSQDAWWIALLSFVPPLAPVLILARLALGHVPAWQVVLDVVAMLGAIYLTARVAARIYAHTLVRGGMRMRWGEAFRLRDE